VLAFVLKEVILIDDKLLPATLIQYAAHETPFTNWQAVKAKTNSSTM